MTAPSRFRFADFTLSPRQRLLLRGDQSVPLIPKYFDLLHLLIERRHEAVSKDAIFAAVWADVIVSDGALAQAVRTLRRTLGDDVREPRFIRTVSRHGYQFVWLDVVEEADTAVAVSPPMATTVTPSTSVAPLVEQLLAADDPAEARELAERLHVIGTGEAIADLTQRPHHAPAIAMMRDARWSVPDAGQVPLLRDPEAPRAIAALVRLRLGEAKRLAELRVMHAAVAGAAGGAAAGVVGGLALFFSPGSHAHLQATIALAAIGAAAGAIGTAGVSAGIAMAEVLARSQRTVSLIVCGALSGGFIAAAGAIVAQALLEELMGLSTVHPRGFVEGVVIGGSAALGYALTTVRFGAGLAAPRGRRRLRVVLGTGVCCALGTWLLASLDRPLVGGLVHEIARSSRDADLVLEPLGRLIGEPDFGPRSRQVLSAFEGFIFGLSLAAGMTYRSPERAPR